MSATEEDTELRDLLIQNLETSGVLNKIKAELRAAVFLALEEQEKVENKTPLVNESLKKFLNTKDGRLVASLISDFLQFFNLDFTMAVFQPEISTLNGLESRDAVARELGIPDTEATKGAPLLLELMKRGRHKDRGSSFAEELSLKQIAEARKNFDHYDKDRNGEINKEELRILFTDLFPHFHKNMLERYVTDEFRAVDKDFNNSIDFDEFLGMYKRLFIQCRSVVTNDLSDIVQTPSKFHEEKLHFTPVSKVIESSHSELSLPTGGVKNKSNVHISASESKLDSKLNSNVPAVKKGKDFDLNNEEDEGDSFFDDPLPRPEKTYGCISLADKSVSGASISENKMNNNHKEWSHTDKSISGGSLSKSKKNGSSHKEITGKNSDTDEETEDPFVENGNRHNPEERRTDSSRPVGSLASLSDAPPLKTGLGSLAGVPPLKGPTDIGNGKDIDLKDLKTMNEKIGSLGLVPAIDQIKLKVKLALERRLKKSFLLRGWLSMPVISLMTSHWITAFHSSVKLLTTWRKLHRHAVMYNRSDGTVQTILLYSKSWNLKTLSVPFLYRCILN
ncbi:centrosomal protein 43-like isoform X2 [Acipenser ruthenus]|uniref:centrosomal protein 43-like isoform X2 n=1 Tax=Acipenser ruthenus TaxID=7906 RepID=UPI00145ACFDA|nr:centrosomal protein 43-like isoform X2 [Acipenser ruthenus]